MEEKKSAPQQKPGGARDDRDAQLAELLDTLRPETPIEQALFEEDAFIRGLLWGSPRFGHPEGQIWKHIREVLDNIDRLQLSSADRRRLRLIAFAHDTFKYKEDKSWPRDWTRHHGVFARDFLSAFTRDCPVLVIAELHDEAFYSWRLRHLFNQPAAGEERLQRLLKQIHGFEQLYYSFFWCDTRTGDKNPAPLHWFEDYVPVISPLPRSPLN